MWVTPADARERYRLSEDTFTNGINELEGHWLVKVTKRPQGADVWLLESVCETLRSRPRTPRRHGDRMRLHTQNGR